MTNSMGSAAAAAAAAAEEVCDDVITTWMPWRMHKKIAL
jgi:hypothetical protein